MLRPSVIGLVMIAAIALTPAPALACRCLIPASIPTDKEVDSRSRMFPRALFEATVSAMCLTLPFTVGQRYLIDGYYRLPNTVVTGMCSLTGPIDLSTKTIARLKLLTRP